ncbi:MAG: hypothetical protein ABSF26_17535 [Thermoguttaceae bacterium]|jgi:threonine/homoserine/homoserine lactone efflux protein
MNHTKDKRGRFDMLFVVVLLVCLCALILLLRIQDLYDIVRLSVAAILFAYLGWKSGAIKNSPQGGGDEE